MTLDERIASALTMETASGAIASLIQEAEVTLDRAEADAATESERTLDPLSLGEEAAQAREALSAAQFTRDRLRTALPRLRATLKQASAAEYAARWQAEYERAEAKRNEVAGELSEAYQAAVARLVDVFRRARGVDEEVDAINAKAPDGEGRRLQRVERYALGLPNDLGNSSPLIDRVQLPVWSNDRVMAWPPYHPPFATYLLSARSQR